MTDESRRANIQAEAEKAATSLRAAEALFDLDLFDDRGPAAPRRDRQPSSALVAV